MSYFRNQFSYVVVLIACYGFAGFATASDAVRTIDKGLGRFTVELGGIPVDTFTYKPDSYRDGPLLIVLSGAGRNAETYCKHARRLADRLDAIVAAPCFDLERFSVTAYQEGGIFENGQVQCANRWTVSWIPQLAEEIRRLEGKSKLPYYLVGHSAGGQFLVRLAGMTQPDALRIVAANPGTHLFPTRDISYPYGFGGLPDELSNDVALQRYLASPLTIYLGTGDVDKSSSLPPDAFFQGANRYERGQNCYAFAAKLAEKNNWKFSWRLVEAPGIKHNAKKMFDHELALEALKSTNK